MNTETLGKNIAALRREKGAKQEELAAISRECALPGGKEIPCDAVKNIRQTGCKMLGAVLNNVVRAHSNYYYYDRQGRRKKRRGSGTENGGR